MRVTGGKEMTALLRRIARHPTPGERKTARAKALNPLIVEARLRLVANQSIETGKLLKSLGVAHERGEKTSAGPRKGFRHANVAHFVEFGTSAHFQPRRFGGIWHRGARPKPFLRPAFEMEKGEVMETLAKEVLNYLSKAAGAQPRRR